ncbi:MAG: hypothetical protein ABI469_04445 [Gemmatimonadales bacterium]
MVQSGSFARSRFRPVVAACGLAVALLGCAPVETAVTVDPGSSFTLPVGNTAALRGTDTRLTFKEVSADSRCPTDVVCVWAGDATIVVVISRNGAPDEAQTLNINPPNNEITSGNLRIKFVGLAPVPRQSDKNPRAYIAQFVVDRI